MAKFLFVYHGGGMPKTEADKAKAMDAWGKWMGGMGSALVDGGHPVGKSSTVNSDGSVSDHGGANPASGYSLVEAANLQAALAPPRAARSARWAGRSKWPKPWTCESVDPALATKPFTQGDGVGARGGLRSRTRRLQGKPRAVPRSAHGPAGATAPT